MWLCLAASGLPVLCDFLHFLEDITELFVVPPRQIVMVVQDNAEVPTTWSCEAIRCQRNWFDANYSQVLPSFLLGPNENKCLWTTELSPSLEVHLVKFLRSESSSTAGFDSMCVYVYIYLLYCSSTKKLPWKKQVDARLSCWDNCSRQKIDVCIQA